MSRYAAGEQIMPLKESPWVSHTHTHLGGECPHEKIHALVRKLHDPVLELREKHNLKRLRP
jgi:hypothetical protein